MHTIGQLIITAMSIYSFLIIIYILMSWFPGSRDTTFGQFLGSIVEPYLEPFRRFIPPLGMLDLSPLVAIIILGLAQSGVRAIFF